MSAEFRPIIMRSNRLLGAALVERNLITVEQLNEATERFLQMLDSGMERGGALLNVLTNELKAISEDTILDHLVDELSLGLLDLRDLDVNDDVKVHLKPGLCWATWTVPFDKDDDVYYVASAYYLSQAVRQQWEKQLGSAIVWFGARMDSIAEFLEKLEAERATHAGIAAGAA